MKHSRACFIVTCAVLSTMLCACTMKIGKTEHEVTLMSGNGLHLAGQKIYVAMPHTTVKDVDAGAIAAQTQQVIQAALSRTSGEKTYAPVAQSMPDGFTDAKATDCTYFVWSEILDWYDPPASVQFVPDRGEVALSVYDAQTGALLQYNKVSCKGFATTVNFIGAYSPKDCLKPAFAEWVAKNM